MTDELDTASQLCADIEEDFLKRRKRRKPLERAWQLNCNFVKGEQYCALDRSGEICPVDKKYAWEQRRVFNHIAPVVDTRLSKLSGIRPQLAVRAASADEKDKRAANLAAAILASAGEDTDLDGVLSAATSWSEICGTAFYKICWNSETGARVGMADGGGTIREGNVQISAVSPFEIFPYSEKEESIAAQPSIIHAKALPVCEIYEIYGVRLEGRKAKELNFVLSGGEDESKAYELVLERYEKPTRARPEGRFSVTAGGKLLYDGVLPYINGADGTRGYPFVKQVSVPVAGSFFGSSVVERLIPLQRAYNAVKNRKHEFLNRISMGTVAVEDGSVDMDELTDDGLAPGKILVYRQGGTPPEMLSLGSVPDEFWKEEENLLAEFVRVSGTSGFSEGADSFAGITSATGLQLIIEQTDARLNVAYQSLKRAMKEVGKQVLRLFRQFAGEARLLKYAGENGVNEVCCFKGSDISSDDVVIEADSELNMTPAQRRTVIYELMEKGLFSDENGVISPSSKRKILYMLGYSSFSAGRDLKEMNFARAAEENAVMEREEAEVKDYDDHSAHIEEHTAYLLSAKREKEQEKRIYAHILIHRQKLNERKKEDKWITENK